MSATGLVSGNETEQPVPVSPDSTTIPGDASAPPRPTTPPGFICRNMSYTPKRPLYRPQMAQASDDPNGPSAGSPSNSLPNLPPIY
ncbi:MAG: hypothetical protein H6668_12315 [Ardenticatenaceae bacterium]|nr:hypothetical protein [Ardenticatenaceae bacterium]